MAAIGTGFASAADGVFAAPASRAAQAGVGCAATAIVGQGAWQLGKKLRSH